MPGRPGSNVRRLRRAILVRVTDGVADALDAMAAERGVTTNSVARDILVLGADLAADDRRIVRQRTRQPAPADDIVTMVKLANNAERLNGWLVQTAKRLREDGIEDLHMEFEDVLTELKGHARDWGVLISRASKRDHDDLAVVRHGVFEAAADEMEAA